MHRGMHPYQNSALRGWGLQLNTLQRNPRNNLSIIQNIQRILSRARQAQPRYIKNEVLAPEKCLRWRFSHRELNPRTALRKNRFSIRIDKRNLNGVFPLIPCPKKEPQGNRAVRMHGRILPRTNGVKGTQHTKLALIITGRIGDEGGENFHKRMISNRSPFSKWYGCASRSSQDDPEGRPYRFSHLKIPSPFIPFFTLNFTYAPFSPLHHGWRLW